jgi:hypothetical protein
VITFLHILYTHNQIVFCLQPYEFVVGEPVLGVTLKKSEAEGGNGLFTGNPASARSISS